MLGVNRKKMMKSDSGKPEGKGEWHPDKEDCVNQSWETSFQQQYQDLNRYVVALMKANMLDVEGEALTGGI